MILYFGAVDCHHLLNHNFCLVVQATVNFLFANLKCYLFGCPCRLHLRVSKVKPKARTDNEKELDLSDIPKHFQIALMRHAVHLIVISYGGCYNIIFYIICNNYYIIIWRRLEYRGLFIKHFRYLHC